MNKLIFIGLLPFFLFGAATLHAQEAESNVAITLERTACRGVCPIYTVTILEDGTVTYVGENFVEMTGEQVTEIEPETVALMVEAFENAGYFGWDEAYDTQTVSDLPSVITSVTRDGETHRIVRYIGDRTAPLALPFLEHWIDEMTHTVIWTGIQPDISGISNGTDTPMITLQRGVCFGACPTYSIAAYQDGTVVYTGIANVTEMGVHVYDKDDFLVTGAAQIAQATGYFDWEDSYDQFVITDQATVTTMIRWEDQFKRITRYLGDPNAPVGLVWIEDSIDRLAAEPVG